MVCIWRAMGALNSGCSADGKLERAEWSGPGAWGMGLRCLQCVVSRCVVCVVLLLLASFVEGTARVVTGNSATTGRDNESQSSGLDAGLSSLSSLASCLVACTTYLGYLR